MDIFEEIEKRQIQFINLLFTDILGLSRSVMIPSGKIDSALDEGVHFDGSSVVGYATIDESDMVLKPDSSTFTLLPWTHPETSISGKCLGQPTAVVICDVYSPDGKPFTGDPRHILKRHLKKAEEKGYLFNVGPEFEFFLFKMENEQPTIKINDHGGYFELLSAEGQKVVTEAVHYLNLMGFDVEATHHEVAPSQYEIDPHYTDALTMADRILLMKHTLKTIAASHGLYATFMPKPLYGLCGNGMHVNQSLFKTDGTNAFHDPDGRWGLSNVALSYLSGLLEHARDTCAILASWVNSYKRLVEGYEAPVYITWANMNRSALIRIPAARGKRTRIELRNPDPAGNPYLQFAVMLSSGLKGIEDRLQPPEPVEKEPEKKRVDLPLVLPEPVEKNVYKLSQEERKKLGINSLPANLGEALHFLEKSELMWKSLGSTLMNHFLRVKKKEYDEYRTQVTSWEVERFLPVL